MTQCRKDVESWKTQCGAQRKHINIIWSHGHECHFAEVQSGYIRRWRHLSLDQSEPTSRHATRSVERTSNRGKRSVERNENTSISSGVTATNAISPRCNQGTFDGGATYHSTNQSRPPGMQSAVVGSRRVSATMHKCATCGRAFTRRDHPYKQLYTANIFKKKKKKKR